jgi:polysaccharide deacetylase family protein (PEP-CTERM system associated)
MEEQKQLINALTVDVEDYYQVEAFADLIRREDWNQWESRVERNTRELLSVFDRAGVRATFFTLGWVAEKHPQLIREIAQAGHEIACHSYEHRLIYQQTPDGFQQDLRRARKILEDVTGQQVQGYRAPSYSITAKSLWALDILIEEGFSYDSSIFPVHHDRYGIPEADRFPHWIHRDNGKIIEFPPSTLRMLKTNIPISGGGYFRLFPYQLFRQGFGYINRRENQAAIFFIHPWEIDPDQPQIKASRTTTLRHRLNLKRTQSRLEKLLGDFAFAPVQQVLRQQVLMQEYNQQLLAESHHPHPATN